MNYVVISTFKTFKNLQKQINIFEKQKHKPLSWHIFNDSDEEEIKYKTSFPIKIINGKRNNYWYYKRLAVNLNKVLKSFSKKDWAKIDCVLKLDDDTIITNNYVEKLTPFVIDSNFGCVSGKILSKIKGKYVNEVRINHYALGTGMLIRKEIFDYLKGYPRIAGSDTVINIASRYLKYQNQQLNNIVIKQTRPTCSESGTTRAIATAVKQYYLRYPFIIIILNLRRSNKKLFFSNYKQFKLLTKDVKNEERLANKGLVNFNRVRLIITIFRDLKKKVLS
jgi:hypothetical protein